VTPRVEPTLRDDARVVAPLTPSVLDNDVAPVTLIVVPTLSEEESVVAPLTTSVLDKVVAPFTLTLPPTNNEPEIPSPPVIITLPVEVEVEGTLAVNVATPTWMEVEDRVAGPETVRVLDKVVGPVTANVVPTLSEDDSEEGPTAEKVPPRYKAPLTPTPPETTRAPVVLEEAGMPDVNKV